MKKQKLSKQDTLNQVIAGIVVFLIIVILSLFFAVQAVGAQGPDKVEAWQLNRGQQTCTLGETPANTVGNGVWFLTEAECIAQLDPIDEEPGPGNGGGNGNTVTAYHLGQNCAEGQVNESAIGNGQWFATLQECLDALNGPGTPEPPVDDPGDPGDPTQPGLDAGRKVSCQLAYFMITTNLHKDVGYRILDNHPFCQVLIQRWYGVNIDEAYRRLNP